MAYKLNLKKRILLGYLAPLTLMLGVSVAVYWNVETLKGVVHETQRSYDVVDDVQAAYIAALRMQVTTRTLVLQKNETTLKIYTETRAALPGILQRLTPKVTDPGQREILRRMLPLSEALREFLQQVVDLVHAGDAAGAAELFRTGEGAALGQQFAGEVAKFRERQAELLAEQTKEQRQSMSTLVNVVLGATTLAIVLAITLGAWIASRISGTIGEAIAGMGTSSTEIAATVDEHQRMVTQQVAAVSQTTSTVEELGASSRQSATQAESMAEATKQSLAVTQEGIRLANQVSTSMTAMKQKVGSVAEQILRLSEQAGQIGGIAKVVGELAGETNMLALNAAVEAARAGEHGKGFAVVASEVRKLADQSKKSAERANALVAEIQKATNSAVMVTEEGTTTADAVAAIIEKTLAAFASISSSANSVAVSAQQVLLNSKQQAAALGQVTEAMKSLSAGSTQMAAGTDQTKKGVQNLNSVAQDLQAMV